MNKEEKSLIKEELLKKLDSIEYINIQINSINGIGFYNNKKIFFKIVDLSSFIKEINGYLMSINKIPIMNIIETMEISSLNKLVIIYEYDENISNNKGLLNDLLVKNDLKEDISKEDEILFNRVLTMYKKLYDNASVKLYYSTNSSNDIFFKGRIDSRLKNWYFNNKFDINVTLPDDKNFSFKKILNETYNYFTKEKKQLCIFSQGDPNTLNISYKPGFFDLATAGYNFIISELSITLISTLIYDNYFAPKYHKNSYLKHEKAIEQAQNFSPNIKISKDKNKVNLECNIKTSYIRKKYITNYLKILKENNIIINEEIKYYIVMRLLCVFNVNNMTEEDYYYSIYLVCYFYENIENDFYKSISKIVNEMESVS